jgi:ribosome maturation factor RimP
MSCVGAVARIGRTAKPTARKWASTPTFCFPRWRRRNPGGDGRTGHRKGGEHATSAVTARIWALTLPLAQANHAELIDVQVKGAGSRMLVRVVVDRKGGIDLGSCQQLSGELSAALDAADLIDSRYVLEVTSPGVDYPLTDQAAFDRVQGRTVLVHRREQASGAGGAAEPADAVTQLRGMVTAADPDAVVLDVDGEPVRVPYREIVKATQALPW